MSRIADGSPRAAAATNVLDLRLVDDAGVRYIRGGGREIGPGRYRLSVGVDRPIVEGKFALRLRYTNPKGARSTLTYDVTAKLRR